MRHLCFSILFCCCLSVSFGQKISFESKTAKQKTGSHIKFTCQLSEIESEFKAIELCDKLRTCEGILKADVLNSSVNKATLVLVTEPKGGALKVQNAFLKFGFDYVYIDEKKVKTTEAIDYFSNLAKANSSK